MYGLHVCAPRAFATPVRPAPITDDDGSITTAARLPPHVSRIGNQIHVTQAPRAGAALLCHVRELRARCPCAPSSSCRPGGGGGGGGAHQARLSPTPTYIIREFASTLTYIAIAIFCGVFDATLRRFADSDILEFQPPRVYYF